MNRSRTVTALLAVNTNRQGTRRFVVERGVLGMPISFTDRNEHDQAIQTMQATLGEPAFAATWAEGQMMTLDEAGALALKAEPAGGL